MLAELRGNSFLHNRKDLLGSKGCGGVMRVAPIGPISASAKPRTAFVLAAEAAALTHGHS
jgi:ADP-ribosylglycohydrolase